MPGSIWVVDAFTEQPFTGNPAGVCLLESWPADDWLLAVAAELRHSETAFLVTRADGDHALRWFTPALEVDLCGHATLAAAHVLGGVRRFHTASGVLTCRPVDDGWIELDFPALPPVPAAHDALLARALGTTDVYAVGRSRFDLLVELGSAEQVRGLRPHLATIAQLEVRGVIVTAPGDRPGIDCVSRCFYPAAGVPEDPVTGSAHCVLAPFWSKRLGREVLVGEQASSRGGIVRMRVDGNRVHLGGRAVTVWAGELLAHPT